NCSLKPGMRKLSAGMRKASAQGSSLGLNQTSANFSPRNFKAAHCFEGGCSEKFIPHLHGGAGFLPFYQAPFLRHDWHFLCVSFWRDLSPDRHLGRTRPLFGSIIDGLAKRELCQTQGLHIATLKQCM